MGETKRELMAEAAELPTPDHITADQLAEFYASDVWLATRAYFARSIDSCLDTILSKDFPPDQIPYMRGFVRGLEQILISQEVMMSTLGNASQMRELMLEKGREDEVSNSADVMSSIARILAKIEAKLDAKEDA